MKINKDLKIEIRPIPERNGIREYSDKLEYFSQAHTIPCLVDPVSLRYATGLSKEDVEFLKEEKFPYNIDDRYVRGVAHEFWESTMLKVALKPTPMFLYPGKNLMDFVKYKYLLVSQYIYNSEAEMLSGTKSEATHYIYDESEATTLKATVIEKRNNLINKVSKLSLKRKRDMILLIYNENTENKDEDYLTVRFEDIYADKDKSKDLEELLKKSASDLSLSALIKTAIQKNVLRRTKQGIFFFESNLGFAEENVKEFLSVDANQEILLNITEKTQ